MNVFQCVSDLSDLRKRLQRETHRERERERERHGLRLRRGILRSCRDLYSFPCFNSKFTELIVMKTDVKINVHIISASFRRFTMF